MKVTTLNAEAAEYAEPDFLCALSDLPVGCCDLRP
jgi:hypothetical protein